MQRWTSVSYTHLSSFTRIAGCYVDKDGDFDGSFNVNFLKLSAAEKKKNIELAKVVQMCIRDSMWKLIFQMIQWVIHLCQMQ